MPLFFLALTNIVLGKQDASDATLATLQAIEHNAAKQAQVLVEMCSFAGSTQVLKVQNLMHYCDDHIDKSKEGSTEDDTFQAFAVIGVALVAMGEYVGADMAIRQFNHLVSILPKRQYLP